jgi:hypothetical protein
MIKMQETKALKKLESDSTLGAFSNTSLSNPIA